MTGKSHLTTGVCTVILLQSAYFAVQSDVDFVAKGLCDMLIQPVYHCMTDRMSIPTPIFGILSLFLFCIGLLLPDIDSEKSMLGRFFHLPVEHHKWTHTFYFLAPSIVLGYFLTPFRWLAFGYFVHLLFDSVGAQGVCWFNPIMGYRSYGKAKVKKHHPHIFRWYHTAQPTEYIFVGLYIGLTIFVCYLTRHMWVA